MSTVEASGKLTALAQLLSEAGINESSIVAADNDDSLLYCDDTIDPPDAYKELMSYQGSTEMVTDDSECIRSKCLVFSQFSASLDLVEELLFKRKMPSLKYLRLDRHVPPEKRAELAEVFNNDPSISVLLLTTRVGSLGLNLTGTLVCFSFRYLHWTLIHISCCKRG